jgi:glycerate-2-kinase
VAQAHGFNDVTVEPEPVEGDVRVVAGAYAEWARHHLKKARSRLMVRFGEPTVRVEGGVKMGRGGRSQQLALAVAREIAGWESWEFLAAGSDGRDGPTDAAGAIVDTTSWKRAQELGLDPLKHLRQFDAYGVHERLGGLLKTGQTGNNLQDLHLLWLK